MAAYSVLQAQPLVMDGKATFGNFGQLVLLFVKAKLFLLVFPAKIHSRSTVHSGSTCIVSISTAILTNQVNLQIWPPIVSYKCNLWKLQSIRASFCESKTFSFHSFLAKINRRSTLCIGSPSFISLSNVILQVWTPIVSNMLTLWFWFL